MTDKRYSQRRQPAFGLFRFRCQIHS